MSLLFTSRCHKKMDKQSAQNLLTKLRQFYPRKKLHYVFFIFSLSALALNTPIFLKRLAKNAAFSNEFVTYQAINILNKNLKNYETQKLKSLEELQVEIERSLLGEDNGIQEDDGGLGGEMMAREGEEVSFKVGVFLFC